SSPLQSGRRQPASARICPWSSPASEPVFIGVRCWPRVSKMKILLIGALGQLGTDLRQVLSGHDVTSVDKEEIDVCDPAQADAMADALRPEVLLNCSAFNRVDEAED